MSPNASAGNTGFLVKWLTRLAVAGLCLVLLLAGIATVFEQSIGRRLIREINKELKAELKIGSFSLSLLSGFPNASGDLRKVQLSDAFGGTLLKADKVAFRFGLLSLFGGRIEVHSLLIEGGTLNIRIDSRGRANYDISRSPAKKSEGDLQLAINKARLRDVTLLYANDRDRQRADAAISKAVFSGAFSSKQFSLTSGAELHTGGLEIAGRRWMRDKDLAYDAVVTVDLVRQQYDIRRFDLSVGKSRFDVTGQVRTDPARGTYFDLVAGAPDGDLAAVLQLLPPQLLQRWGDLRTSGNFALDLRAKGWWNQREQPAVNARLSLDRGSIAASRLSATLRNVSFNARFDCPANNGANAVFELPDFRCQVGSQPFQLRLTVRGLDNPFIDLSASGQASLADLYTTAGITGPENPRGFLNCTRLTAKGRYRDILAGRLEAAGTLALQDIGFRYHGDDIAVPAGSFLLNNNELLTKNLVVKTPAGTLTFEGEFNDWLAAILSEAPLRCQAKLSSPRLDAARLVAMVAPPPAPLIPRGIGAPPTPETGNPLLKKIMGLFKVEIDQLSYGKIAARNCIGQLKMTGSEEIDLYADVETMGGDMDVEGRFFLTARPYLKARLNGNDINMKEFFRQCNNFGQQVLTDANIAGVLDTRILLEAYWDANGRFLDDKLRVVAGLNINNGELVDCRLLEDFSTFIKIQDLQHIRFTNLRNWLEISNRRLYLPVMTIQCNALNLVLNGEHSFDNAINYNLKVNAGQVVLNRFRKFNPTLDPQEMQDGWFNLYYNISGYIGRLQSKLARQEVKTSFEKSEGRKRYLQTLLEAETGTADFTAPLRTAPPPAAFANPKHEPRPPRASKKPAAKVDDDVEYIEGF